MNLLTLYNLLQTSQLTEEQVAATLGLSLKNFRFRRTRWGHKLPLLLATLDKISADAISRDGAAATLDVTTRQINKLEKTWKISRPVKAYLVDRAASQVKWEMHAKFAIDFISGSMSFEDAAELAGLSVRQMRREVSHLLKMHIDMPYKDLKTLTDIRRRRIADKIERLENMEMAKQNVIKCIADGETSIQEEALNRVLARKINIDRRKPQTSV